MFEIEHWAGLESFAKLDTGESVEGVFGVVGFGVEDSDAEVLFDFFVRAVLDPLLFDPHVEEFSEVVIDEALDIF